MCKLRLFLLTQLPTVNLWKLTNVVFRKNGPIKRRGRVICQDDEAACVAVNMFGGRGSVTLFTWKQIGMSWQWCRWVERC